MKDSLFKIFSHFFQAQISQIQASAQQSGMLAEKDRINERRSECKAIEFQMLVGHPVIAVSNEWENPIVGFGHEVEFISKAKTPILSIKDVLTGEIFMSFGKVYYFTQQRLEAIMKLTPFELCSLLYDSTNYDCTFEKNKLHERDTLEVFEQKLRESGFFDKLAQLTV